MDCWVQDRGKCDKGYWVQDKGKYDMECWVQAKCNCDIDIALTLGFVLNYPPFVCTHVFWGGLLTNAVKYLISCV